MYQNFRLMIKDFRSRVKAWVSKDSAVAPLSNWNKVPSQHAEVPLRIAIVSQPHSFGAIVDSYFSGLLNSLGHQATIFYDDGMMPINESLPWESESTWALRKSIAVNRARCAYKSVSANAKGLSELNLIEKPVDRTDCHYQTIHGCSILRHYRVGMLKDELPGLQRRNEMTWEAISISASLGRYIAENDFDRVIVNHGLYSSTGPMRLVAQENNIPVLSYDLAKRKDHMNFTWNHSSDEWWIEELWEEFRDKELNIQQKEVLASYLQSRRSHKLDQHVYNFGAESSVEALKAELGIPADKRMATLFTNVLWDAAAASREICFESSLDWVVQTIRWFENNPDYYLAIKIHPAETVIGTQQSFFDLLNQSVPELPSNVVVVQPDAEVNSFTFCAASDLGLVHTSTVGMEMALEGKPVVTVAKCHYRGKGLTYDPNDSDEYFSLLHRMDEVGFQPSMQRAAEKYAFLSLCKYQCPFPFVVRDTASEFGGRVEMFEPDSILKHPVIDELASAIVDMRPITCPDELLLRGSE